MIKLAYIFCFLVFHSACSKTYPKNIFPYTGFRIQQKEKGL